MDTLYEDSSKKFLTDAHGEDSSVVWSCTTDKFSYSFLEKEEKKKPSYSTDAFVKFSDCNRTARLDFDLYADGEAGEKQAVKKLDKLNTLINELQNFRDSLEVAYDTKIAYDQEAAK